MPRLPIDYSKTVIYKIVCNDLNVTESYVGHTTDYIRRKQAHKSACNNEKGKRYDLKVYATIRENGGWDNWNMVEVEKYSCNDANEASAKEREWFERLSCSLNTNIPNRSQLESIKNWRERNKDKIKLFNSQYRETHKEEFILYRKRKNENLMCICGGHYIYSNNTHPFKTKFHPEYMDAVILEIDSTITVVPVVQSITDTYLDRGKCHIPLDQEQFKNIIQQKDYNNDYFDYTEYYDYVEQQYSEYCDYRLLTNTTI